MWPDLIEKAKDGGLDVIETYVFWNLHEPRRKQYDFSGNLDVVKFFNLVQEGEAGMYGFLRIGPYACAEWNCGGFPVWLHNMKGIALRTDNLVYKMQTFTAKIVNLCKAANLFASQGGPIIFAQVSTQMAESLNVGIPWVMCQQNNAPKPIINTCNGYYCDQFTPNNPSSPKMWTENWIGWFKSWGAQDPRRTAEDAAFAVARFFQYNGYHGGTNFGRTSGGPYITTSYDYDAPLDEYGNLNQPKWGHLKQLHAAIKSGEKILTSGNSSVTQFPNNVNVNTQTSLMIKKPSSGNGTKNPLSWSWAAEPMDDTLKGKGTFKTTRLLEQKETTFDASDYLWYMTTVNLNGTSWNNANLSVNTSGHVLHAFVNGKLIGHYNFLFNKAATFNSGSNIISLLSATNYGSFFDLQPTGINGPVKLLGSGSDVMNLSSNSWSYKVKILGKLEKFWKHCFSIAYKLKITSCPFDFISGRRVGLNSEAHKFHHGDVSATKWPSNNLPSGQPFTWYKTSFQTPPGTDPVVVDLQGMAWVNGNSLGRFWPSYLAANAKCSDTCDYRGAYAAKKCVQNCGNPTQRWYHIPRSLLNKNNTLVLFEEFGGNPSQVGIQTVTVGTACGNAYDGNSLELSCQGGQKISAIQFASFGNPTGSCGSYQKGPCDSADSLSAAQKACVGKMSCSLNVSQGSFGSSSCGSTNRLAVQATC
ncbi:hypothetical protein MANES_16G092900v8 [Manihot esculenta]|uniref:Uncharacterized protein n=1 Tax=Manihot esculenta TaxID=3983 RepID=A0ACB7GBE0_MANES|nr:hypothetical protein MANES_16G092900v8 [Manihot esculenta]